MTAPLHYYYYYYYKLYCTAASSLMYVLLASSVHNYIHGPIFPSLLDTTGYKAADINTSKTVIS